MCFVDGQPVGGAQRFLDWAATMGYSDYRQIFDDWYTRVQSCDSVCPLFRPVPLYKALARDAYLQRFNDPDVRQ